jgi:hypothetical protein
MIILHLPGEFFAPLLKRHAPSRLKGQMIYQSEKLTNFYTVLRASTLLMQYFTRNVVSSTRMKGKVRWVIQSLIINTPKHMYL